MRAGTMDCATDILLCLPKESMQRALPHLKCPLTTVLPLFMLPWSCVLVERVYEATLYMVSVFDSTTSSLSTLL